MASPSTPDRLIKWSFTDPGAVSSVLTLHCDLPLPSLPDPRVDTKVATKLKLVENSDDPRATIEWVRVRVTHASLNPAGVYQAIIIPSFLRQGGKKQAQTPEFDSAGYVEEVVVASPAGAMTTQNTETKFTRGDKVWVHLDLNYWLATGTGALASHISVPAQYVTRIPSLPSDDSSIDKKKAHASSLLLEQASCMGVATYTAWAAVERADPQLGDRVLVVAAAGGIGTQVVQMVRQRIGKEGKIVGVCKRGCSNQDEQYNTEAIVKALGVDEVVDYSTVDVVAELKQRYGHSHSTEEQGDRRFDHIIDCIGVQAVYKVSRHFSKPNSVYVSVGVCPSRRYSALCALASLWTMALNLIWPRSPWLGGTGRQWTVIHEYVPTADDREKVMHWVTDGELRAPVDSRFGYRNVKEAYERLMGGGAVGKVIVDWTREE